MAKQMDLIVIGAGSGGLAMAKKAAALGAAVVLIEKGKIGGTCVNVGCVPKKMTWYAGDIAEKFHLAASYGFHGKDYSFDFKEFVLRRQQYIVKLNQIYAHQLQTSHIHYVQGVAEFIDSHAIKVNNEVYTAHQIVIATGCYPHRPAIQGAEYGIDSDGFFDLSVLPKKVVIVGAGYIAVELASMLNQLGSQVTILIRHDTFLRSFDSLLGESLMEIMRNQGIEIETQCQLRAVTRNTDGKLTLDCDNGKMIAQIDTLIFAIGRLPQTQKLNLSHAKIKTDASGFILTDKWERTNIPHIHAIGDVTGKKLLTPVAIAAGRQLATRLFGLKKDAYLDYDNIPTVIFSHPPIGTVGLSEHDAVNKYGREQLHIYQTRFNSLFYSLSETKIPSRMKLITLKESGKIIGCHMIGIGADEILQGFAVAIKMGATKQDFDNTVAIHPTNAEELVLMS